MSIGFFCMFTVAKVTRKNGTKIYPEKVASLKVSTVAKVYT